MSDEVIIERNGHILDIQFNRPDKKNALTLKMYTAMTEALAAAEKDLEVRVVLFHGTGGNFTSGNDVNDFLSNPPIDDTAPALQFISAIARATVPIVAAIDGVSVGVGTTMLLHCDYILVTEDARLQFPFINLALLPEAGSTHLLPRLLGYTRAAELALLAEEFSGARAVELGIASKIVKAEHIHEEAKAIADKFAAKPPKAVRMAKRMLKGEQARMDAIIAEEARIFGEQLTSPEAREAFSAFIEKRKPDFSGLS
jgi:enoyl-CoA hydratase/carnithine racemase